MSVRADAEGLLKAMAGELGLDTGMVAEAYEDPASGSSRKASCRTMSTLPTRSWRILKSEAAWPASSSAA